MYGKQTHIIFLWLTVTGSYPHFFFALVVEIYDQNMSYSKDDNIRQLNIAKKEDTGKK